MSITTSPTTIEALNFLSRDQIDAILPRYGSPVFAYSEKKLLEMASQALAFPAPYGLTVRYAMKANPLRAILQVFDKKDIHIDASSGFEAERAIRAGINPAHIMITSQQIPDNLKDLVNAGVKFNATSLHQLEQYGKLNLSRPLSIRINAGTGSGYRPGVSVAGQGASFGIWHEYIDQIKDVAKKYHLMINSIHSHIGCGNDPITWRNVAHKTLTLLENFPEIVILNLGGGFKVGRMSNESGTDLQELGSKLSLLLTDFAGRTGRKLHLEIEPGTFLVANTGSLISKVQDMSDTGRQGFSFIKLDTGMNDIMRPALHASQHPIIVISKNPLTLEKYVVVGHNCESSDLLTPSIDNAETPEPRLLARANIGDAVVLEGVGAYCSSMRLIGYNSFPTPNEIMIMESGEIRLINRQQTVEDLTSSETA
jgi:diaminopimelate decarboxylase